MCFLILAMAVTVFSTLALAQRVVDPDAPWKVERAGTPMNRPARLALSQDVATINDGEFVRRVGSLLTLAGKPFRFNGNNLYYNQADIVYGRTAGVEDGCGRRRCGGLLRVAFRRGRACRCRLGIATSGSTPV